MAPNQVSLLSAGLVRRNLCGSVNSKIKFKFRVGDRVLISKSKSSFKKGYLPNWTKDLFSISKRITKEGPICQLTDDSAKILENYKK